MSDVRIQVPNRGSNKLQTRTSQQSVSDTAVLGQDRNKLTRDITQSDTSLLPICYEFSPEAQLSDVGVRHNVSEENFASGSQSKLTCSNETDNSCQSQDSHPVIIDYNMCRKSRIRTYKRKKLTSDAVSLVTTSQVNKIPISELYSVTAGKERSNFFTKARNNDLRTLTTESGLQNVMKEGIPTSPFLSAISCCHPTKESFTNMESKLNPTREINLSKSSYMNIVGSKMGQSKPIKWKDVRSKSTSALSKLLIVSGRAVNDSGLPKVSRSTKIRRQKEQFGAIPHKKEQFSAITHQNIPHLKEQFSIQPHQKEQFGAISHQKEQFGALPHQKEQFVALPHQKEQFGAISHQKEQLFAIPHQKEHFGTIPHQKEHFGTIPHQKEHFGTMPPQKEQLFAIPPQKEQLFAIPHQKEHFGTIPHQKEHFGTIPRQKEQFAAIPHQKEQFGAIPHQKEQFSAIPRQKEQFCAIPRQKEHFGAIPHQKIQFGALPPRHSKKETSVTLTSAMKKRLLETVNSMESSLHILPENLPKVAPNKSRDFHSLSMTPMKIFYSADKVSSSVPIEKNSAALSGVPQQYVGCEDFFHGGKKLKRRRNLQTQRTLTQETGAIVNSQSSKDDAVYYHRKTGVNSQSKHCKKKSCRTRAATQLSKWNSSQALRHSALLRKHEFMVSHSKMVAIRHVPCLTYPLQGILQNNALVLLPAKKYSYKKNRETQRGNKSTHAITLSNSAIKDKQLTPNIQRFNYRQKIPLLRKNSTHSSGNSNFKESLGKSSIAKAYRAFRHSPRQATKHFMPRKYEHFSSITSGTRRNPYLGSCRLMFKASQQKPNCGIVSALTIKGNAKSRTIKRKLGMNKEVDVSSPRICKKLLKKRPHRHFRKRNKLGRNQGNKLDIMRASNINISHYGNNEEMPKITEAESPTYYPSDNPTNRKSCWDGLNNTTESISSYYTKFSSWSKNADGKRLVAHRRERSHMEFLEGTLMLPSTEMPCSTHKLDILNKQALKDHQKKFLSSPTDRNHAVNKQVQNQCCTVTLIPSIFNFFNTIGPASTCKVNSNNSPGSLQIMSVDSSNSKEKSLDIDKFNQADKDSTKEHSETNMTDSEKSLTAEELNMLRIGGSTKCEPKRPYINSKQKLEIWRADYSLHLLKNKGTERLAPKSKTPAKKTFASPLPASPMKVAKSILRTGRIASSSKNQQHLRRTENVNPQSKLTLSPSKLKNPQQNISYECSCEYSNTSTISSSPKVTRKIDHTALTFGLIFVTVIVQAILYLSVPSD